MTITIAPGGHYDIYFKFEAKQHTTIMDVQKTNESDFIMYDMDEANYFHYINKEPFNYTGFVNFSQGNTGNYHSEETGNDVRSNYLVFQNQDQSDEATLTIVIDSYYFDYVNQNPISLQAMVALFVAVGITAGLLAGVYFLQKRM
ncbi:MAG: hypothetical protein SA339_13515 [Methanomassiliicoccus sp.]|nr:hypothetical protein [Methanomassiliicoccus sp.]